MWGGAGEGSPGIFNPWTSPPDLGSRGGEEGRGHRHTSSYHRHRISISKSRFVTMMTMMTMISAPNVQTANMNELLTLNSHRAIDSSWRSAHRSPLVGHPEPNALLRGPTGIRSSGGEGLPSGPLDLGGGGARAGGGA